MKVFLQRLAEGGVLERGEASDALSAIVDGSSTAAMIGAFLASYALRPPVAAELLGFRDALVSRARPLDGLSMLRLLDIVGTGGDRKDTFNISTLAAFVVAGAGILVAKHGNYAASSTCGSSNIIEALGICFPQDAAQARSQLERAGLTFLHAPIWHPCLKPLAPIRKELGFRTIFNLLGPLVNPAMPQVQVLGVSTPGVYELYGSVLNERGGAFAVVHGIDGYDEVSLTGETLIRSGEGSERVSPSDFGLKRVVPDTIKVAGTVQAAAAEAVWILSGQGPDEKESVVLANAAVAIRAYGSAVSLREAVECARESIASGRALAALRTLQAMSEKERYVVCADAQDGKKG